MVIVPTLSMVRPKLTATASADVEIQVALVHSEAGANRGLWIRELHSPIAFRYAT
jgi:hypothetical protein